MKAISAAYIFSTAAFQCAMNLTIKAFLLSISLLPLMQIAQAQRRSTFGAYLSGKYFLNQRNLHQDGIAPDPISTVNMLRPAGGLFYEYTAKSNICFYAAVEYGRQDHEVTLERGFDGFDPEAALSLAEFKHRRTVSTSTRFLALHIMGGYKYQLRKEVKICGRAGIGWYLYRGGISGGHEDFLTYAGDNGTALRYASVLVESTRLGSAEALGSWYQFRNGLNNFEIYFGAEKQVRSRTIQRLEAGVQFSAKILREAGQYVNVVTNSSISSGFNSVDVYNNMNTTIALHLGIGV